MGSTMLLRGGYVLRRREDEYFCEPADIEVEGSSIRSVAPPPPDVSRSEPEDRRHDRVIDAVGKLVFPGLVNAHTHSYGNLARGLFDALPLEPWMPYATAVTMRRTWREGYVSATLGCVEMIRTGTTAVLDQLGGSHESQAGALQAYSDAGVRVALAPMVTDIPAHETIQHGLATPPAVQRRLEQVPPPKRSQVVGQLRELLADWHGKDACMSVLIGPSGPQRCSQELLIACRDLAREFDTGLHTHLLETRTQQAFAQARYGRSMVAYLDELGLLSSRFSGAHAVWCTDADLRILAKADATLVHNPWSNLTLGSGIAPLPSWRESGVGRALGTDGANCGGDLNMFQSMKLATSLHRSSGEPVDTWTTPREIFKLATEGGAGALQLTGRVGRIEPGYEADLVIINLASPTYVPLSDALTQLVYGETGAGVETVIVGGEVVLDERRLTRVDEHALLEEARGMLEAILARNADLLQLAALQSTALRDVSLTSHEPKPA